ncbi:MAG TPA: YegS/Rv2252/BmrU family lipid kinase [Chloroflexota bacterium]
MRAGIIANPRAGRGHALARAEQARQELAADGVEVELACSDAAGVVTELSRAMAHDCELIVVAGGDGTINEALQGIVGSEALLGVIPAGLANVWAHEVGLTTGPGAAVSLLRDGLVFDTDLGLVNGRYFLAMAGIGFDAAVVAAVASDSKARWAQLAYVREALACARTWPAPEVELEMDGVAHMLPLFGIIAANTSNYAGVFELAPDSKLDDGLLELLVYEDGGFASRVRSMLLADGRTRRFDPRARTVSVSEACICSAEPVVAHADAELAGTTPCEIRVISRGMRALLPATAAKRYLRPGRPLTSPAASRSRSR